MTLENHLIVFLKVPRIGRVKSRLAADIGPAAAWRFYRDTTTTVLRRLSGDRRWRTWIALSPDDGRFPAWPALPGFGQGSGDIGVRMDRAMRRPPPGPVVLVGGDVPDIRRADIAAAFRALGDHDAVFGPAQDGGFWLVGMRRRPRHVYPYRGVPWSSPETLARTIANLTPHHRVAFVATLDDVDDGAAFRRYRAGLSRSQPSCAP
ncbi:MAG: hypothetical protein CMM50_14250 [Rhodospirillaceae bacterium]|nr:hypothetical protein [Rhodospirillaceae bacterium]